MSKSIPTSRADKEKDEALLAEIKAVIATRPTYGYRRVTAVLNYHRRQNGMNKVNHKCIYRVMKKFNLLLPKHGIMRPVRSHTGKIMTLRSNTRWCSDCFSIQCWNGDRVHVAFSLDTCDREAMRYIATTKGVDGEMIRDLMLETMEYRFKKEKPRHRIQWLSDNGPPYVAYETIEFGRSLGFDICTTPSYSPESNGMAEAFVKTMKRDYVWVSELKDAKTVMELLPGWFEEYNESAPHKALKMRSPRQFIREKLAG